MSDATKTSEAVESTEATDAADASEQSGESTFDLVPVVEALIFAAEDSLSDRQIASIVTETRGVSVAAADVARAVETLNAAYESDQRAFRIHVWSGGYRMATIAEFASFVKTLYFQQRVTRLSRSLLETVAILAYKQPATKPELDYVRGVDCDHALRRLLELGLVEIAGRADSVGRPLLYQTTPGFMDKFGLASLDNLPTLREIDELIDDPTYNRERAQLLFREGLGLEDSGDEITVDHPREGARRADVTELSNDVSSSSFDVEGDGAVGSDDGYILGEGGQSPPERG